MAEAVAMEGTPRALGGLGRLTIWRQAALLAALAASIAIGVGVAMWSREPGYKMLYASLAGADAGAVGEALNKAGVPYRVDPGSGAILVPAGRVSEARIKLAARGLPRSTEPGFELLDKQQSFGTSQFVERARYQRAMEVELARTIASISNVRNARVHLAVPRQSAFIGTHQQPSASVLVDLYSGRALAPGQAQAIAYLVAAAVPNLESSAVRVVDQKGRLLTRTGNPLGEGVSSAALDYQNRLETGYSHRIEAMLTPLVGSGRVKAEVAAELDLSQSEQSSESYNPDNSALRSEQVVQESGSGGGVPGGVPGALSNQPPGPASAPQQSAGGGTAAGASAAAPTPSAGGRREATRNFELDRTISHVRRSVGNIRRLSVAVVVDDYREQDGAGKVITRARSPEEIARLTALVKQAVGFDAARGDSVQVTSAAFTLPETIAPLPETPIWKQPWVLDAAKQGGGVLLVLALVFGLLRPLMKSLVARDLAERQAIAEGGALEAPGDGLGNDRLSLSGRADAARLPEGAAQVDAVRSLIGGDARRAANVVRDWVKADG